MGIRAGEVEKEKVTILAMAVAGQAGHAPVFLQ